MTLNRVLLVVTATFLVAFGTMYVAVAGLLAENEDY